MSEGRQRWAWAVAIVAVLIILAVWVRDGDDDPESEAPPGASPSAALGRSVDGALVCDLVPADDVADAYDVDADALREAFVMPSSAAEGVSCNIIRGAEALTQVHLYVGDRARELWAGEYADLHSGSPPPGTRPVDDEIGDGAAQDKRIVVVRSTCGSSELLVVLNDPTRQLSSDQLETLARESLPHGRDLVGCPA